MLAAFDTINRTIVVDRVSVWYGECGVALSWFKCYLCYLAPQKMRRLIQILLVACAVAVARGTMWCSLEDANSVMDSFRQSRNGDNAIAASKGFAAYFAG